MASPRSSFAILQPSRPTIDWITPSLENNKDGSLLSVKSPLSPGEPTPPKPHGG